jgi:hypothetical protein
MTSSQCKQSDSNSACFASDDGFNHWICQCKQDFYFDLNYTKKCLRQLSYGQKCNRSEQCLGETSICSHDNYCVCHQDYIYDTKLKGCKHINRNNGCDEDHQWNKFTKQYELKIHYSHKGGIFTLFFRYF